jgi:hypothetical protein
MDASFDPREFTETRSKSSHHFYSLGVDNSNVTRTRCFILSSCNNSISAFDSSRNPRNTELHLRRHGNLFPRGQDSS